MRHCGVLEIAFGRCSCRSEDCSLGTEMSYLGAALVLSAPAVPWLLLGPQLRFPSQGAGWQWNIPAVFRGTSRGYPAVLQGQVPHVGCKIKVAAFFWQLL